MENAHSFPLLRLPNLAREHVILIMGVREQYLFSTLSKKSKKLTKNGVRKLRYCFHSRIFSFESDVAFGKDWSQKWLTINIMPIERADAEDVPLNDIRLRVENYQEQTIQLFIYLEDIFKISTFVLECRELPNEFAKRLLTTVKDLEIDIDRLAVDPEEGQDENDMFIWTMENCRGFKEMYNNCSTSPDFEWNTDQPFTFESCYLRTPFLTLDQVTRLFWGCRKFELVELTNQDLGNLVKSWLNGSSKLEHVSLIANGSFNFQEVMTDVEKVPVESAYIENNMNTFDPGNAFKIRQENGKEAVVCCLEDPTYFVITTHFDENDCDLWSDEDEEEEDGEWED